MEILEKIKRIESPLKRQFLMVALITNLLEQRGKSAPIVIGGCALSYYTREVYFTADIDLAYPDREALDIVLKEIGYRKQGRYWVNDDLNMAIEVPASTLPGEESPVEVVEVADNLYCRIIGIEDLIIDRLNACKYWKSEVDCEMLELITKRYARELDWVYLGKKAGLSENNTGEELAGLKKKAEQ
ncbi:MAG: UbiD family decarboxylase [Nitrospirae bacterium]|nr:UbiD family decarboxylase [Nitrospirota bacterium]